LFKRGSNKCSNKTYCLEFGTAMRKIIIALFILIVLLVGTVLIAPGLVPSSVYKDRIEGQLSKELGRNVAINGDIEVASFPFIRAKTSNVSVDNYDGFENDKFININELDPFNVTVVLHPLIRKSPPLLSVTAVLFLTIN